MFFVGDPDILVEIFLTKILDALLSTLFPWIHNGLEFVDQSPGGPISRDDSILGIAQHEDQFGSMLVVAANFEILQ